MQLRLIAAAGLVAIASQGCYGPQYAPPYSSQGYPVGAYPGPIQTTVPGQQYAPGGTVMPQGGGVPTYSNPPAGFNSGAPAYNPGAGPSATKPVPMYGDAPSASNYQMPTETSGARELGFAPVGGNGLIQTAGAAPTPAAPNPFAGGNAAPLSQPTFAEPTSAPTTISADNFEGGNSGPTTFN
ncbi:MAG TPA: hypothetical protein VM510_09365 [Caulifigura sp.]|nr:hypothetical protein [Caulifigura sp.]